jgi:hypothetical protein
MAELTMDRSIVVFFVALFFSAWGLVYLVDPLFVLSSSVFVFGVYLLSISVYFSYFLKRKIENYSISEGVLISSGVIKVKRDLDPKFIIYIPVIEYEYLVNEKSYIGHNLSLDKNGYAFSDFDKANEILLGLSDVLDVRYYDKNPSISCIFIDVSKQRKNHYKGVMISGVILIIFALVSFAVSV